MEVNGFGQFAAAATPFVQGDRVIIHGKPNLWMKRTSLSLRGDAIIAAGAGWQSEGHDRRITQEA